MRIFALLAALLLASNAVAQEEPTLIAPKSATEGEGEDKPAEPRKPGVRKAITAKDREDALKAEEDRKKAEAEAKAKAEAEAKAQAEREEAERKKAEEAAKAKAEAEAKAK